MRSISSAVDGAPERREQHAGIAARGIRGIEAADHRLERVDVPAGVAQMPDQPGGDEGLADVGAGRGDEDGGHGSALQDASAHDRGEALDLGVGMARR